LKSAFNRSVLIGSAILAAIFVIGLAAPYLGTRDPAQIDPISRNKRPGAVRILTGADGRQVSTTYWMGTDSLGRDIYSRVLFGARVSLLVGISVALISMAAGLAIGLLAGYLRWLDGFVMRQSRSAAPESPVASAPQLPRTISRAKASSASQSYGPLRSAMLSRVQPRARNSSTILWASPTVPRR